MEKLTDSKNQLANQQREINCLKQTTVASIEKAAGVSLLTQLIDGELKDTLNRASKETTALTLRIDTPELVWNDIGGNKPNADGLLGEVRVASKTLFLGAECMLNAGTRYWNGDFGQMFHKPFEQLLEIPIPDYCNKLTISDGNVWVPIRNNNVVNVYNAEGHLQRTIDSEENPVCVEKAFSNEMIVCCQGAGLFVLSEQSKQPLNIERGKYSDMCVYADRIYALEYEKKQIVEFVKVQSGWRRRDVLSIKKVALSCDDSLLVRDCDKGRIGVEFFISLFLRETIVRVTDEGKVTSLYGSSEGVERKASLNGPCLCVLDNANHLLVADHRKHSYKILNNSNSNSTFIALNLYLMILKLGSGHQCYLEQVMFMMSKYRMKTTFG